MPSHSIQFDVYYLPRMKSCEKKKVEIYFFDFVRRLRDARMKIVRSAEISSSKVI